MKTIIVINDNSPESRHAAEFAVAIAQRVQGNVVLANNYVNSNSSLKLITSGKQDEADVQEEGDFDMIEHLKELGSRYPGRKTQIENLDISDMNENELAEAIVQKQVWMIVKGMADFISDVNSEHRLNIHAVLNKVLCPLFLVPSSWELKNIDRLVYVADLRYCRIQVVRYLAEMARGWNADVSIAHLSAKGLPDMAESYALNVFTEEVCKNVNYDRLLFNNIKEKDLFKAVDVLINGMHNDVLVMVNHRYHFEQILGRYITDTLPPHLTVPLLIFPY